MQYVTKTLHLTLYSSSSLYLKGRRQHHQPALSTYRRLGDGCVSAMTEARPPAGERGWAEGKLPTAELTDSVPSAAVTSPLASQADRTWEEKQQQQQNQQSQPPQPQQPHESDGLISRVRNPPSSPPYAPPPGGRTLRF